MSSPRDYEYLEYRETRDGRVAWLRLAREEKLNAMRTEMYGELKSAIRSIDRGPVEIAVITGSGRAFATGGDLDEYLAYLDSADELDIYRFEDNLPFDELRRCSKTLVAAVNGVCVAGGLSIALSCDVQIASERAVFSVPEAAVGLADSLVPALLHGRVSLSKLRYYVLTAKKLDAVTAERIGLVTEVVEHDALMARTSEVVDELLETSFDARTLYKRYMRDLFPIPAIPDMDMYESTFMPSARRRLEEFAKRRRTTDGETGTDA